MTISPSDYQKLCQRTECNQLKSVERITDGAVGEDYFQEGDYSLVPIRVNHAIIGLAGEVGELASLLQEWIYYNKYQLERTENGVPVIVKQQLMEEFGDALWYVAEGLNALGLDMGQVMEANLRKLRTRYPEKYEDVRAAEENRDREAEAKALANEQLEGISKVLSARSTRVNQKVAKLEEAKKVRPETMQRSVGYSEKYHDGLEGVE